MSRLSEVSMPAILALDFDDIVPPVARGWREAASTVTGRPRPPDDLLPRRLLSHRPVVAVAILAI